MSRTSKKAASTDPATYPPEPTPIAGHLPRLPAQQVEAMRELFAEPLVWATAAGVLLRLGSAVAPAASGAVFEVDGDGQRLALQFDPGLGQATDGDLQWNDFAGRARTIAWGLAHESPLSVLGETLGMALLPVGLLSAAGVGDDDTLWLRFDASQEAGAPICGGLLRLPLGALPRLLERAEVEVIDQAEDTLAAQPSDVRISMIGRDLPAATWRKLRRGDVLVLGSRNQPRGAHAHAHGKTWPLVAAENGWSVTGPATPDPLHEDSTMQTHQSEGAGAPDSATEDGGPTRQLPVKLAFDLGTVSLTLGEVAALQPGYVFTLPTRLEGANVVIRANGKAAGRGEVVAVGDTLGVRVLSWE